MEIGSIVITLGAGFVGGGSLLGLFAKFLGDRKLAQQQQRHEKDMQRLRGEHEKEIEDLKARNNRAAMLFEREWEAALDLYSMIRNVHPQYSVPGMDDLYEICERMSRNLHNIEKEIGGYLAKHGAVLPADVHNAIGRAEYIAAEGKFFYAQGQLDSAAKAAEEILDQLGMAWKKLNELVRSRVSA